MATSILGIRNVLLDLGFRPEWRKTFGCVPTDDPTHRAHQSRDLTQANRHTPRRVPAADQRPDTR